MHVRKDKIYRNICNFSDRSDDELIRRFRFTSDGIDYLKRLVQDDIANAHANGRALSADVQVMVALRYLASNDFQIGVADEFCISQATVSNIVTKFCASLNRRVDQFISMPTSDQEKAATFRRFYNIANFPKVLGCLDCTHVRIIQPAIDGIDYMNRKGYYSINVQAVCDPKGKFTNIVCSWPGSTHDSHILRTSQLWQRYEAARPHGFILADNAYPNRSWLLTPFLNPVGIAQGNYNAAHKSTRILIEQCFGRLKRRFSILHSEMRVSPEKAVSVIVACFILHNIATDLRQPEPEGRELADDYILAMQADIAHPDNAVASRNELVQRYFDN